MSSSSGTLKVAVIDRDSAFLKVLGKRLDAAGWQHRVLSGAVPAEELVAMKINALLVDLTVLGSEDAWSFLERVAGMMPGLGVIVCTNDSTVAQRVRGLRLGADDWIAKPCHPEEVMARIEAVVRRRRRATGQTERGPLVTGELEIRADQFQAFVAGRAPRPHPPRVRAARDPRRLGGHRHRARGDLPAGLGLRDGSRRPLGRRLRPQASLEDPAPLAGLVLHPHALRDRLPVRAGADQRPCVKALADAQPAPAAGSQARSRLSSHPFHRR